MSNASRGEVVNSLGGGDAGTNGLSENTSRKKRAKVVPEGRVIRRTGPREEKGTFPTWAKEYAETPGVCSFLSIRWPKYAGDYPLDEEISKWTIAEGLYDILENPMAQLSLPFVYFKLRVAMNGVVFKLSRRAPETPTIG